MSLTMFDRCEGKASKLKMFSVDIPYKFSRDLDIKPMGKG